MPALPPEETRRDRKKQRTRRAIAEAAVRLFESQGYGATTVEQIADAADYAPSTIFRHFAGKEDIIFFDFPDRLDHLREAFARPHQGPTWSTIRAAIIDNATIWDQIPDDFGARRARLFHEVPELHNRYLALSDEWVDDVARLVADERGVDPDTDLTARLVAAAVVAAFHAAWRTQTANRDRSLAGYLGDALDQLEAGLLPGRDLTR